MAPVAIGEWMHQYELVVEPRSDFVQHHEVIVIGQLIGRVVQELPQAHGNLRSCAPDVLVRLPELTGPIPGAVEHPAMEVAAELLGQHRRVALPVEPPLRLQNVGLFPFV